MEQCNIGTTNAPQQILIRYITILVQLKFGTRVEKLNECLHSIRFMLGQKMFFKFDILSKFGQ